MTSAEQRTDTWALPGDVLLLQHDVLTPATLPGYRGEVWALVLAIPWLLRAAFVTGVAPSKSIDVSVSLWGKRADVRLSVGTRTVRGDPGVMAILTLSPAVLFTPTFIRIECGWPLGPAIVVGTHPRTA